MMENNTKFCIEIPHSTLCHANSTQNNKCQGHNQNSHRRSMSLPPSNRHWQENSAVAECLCCGYGYQKCLPSYHLSQCQQSYPQVNSSYQLQSSFLPHILSYEQLRTHPLHTPYGYIVRFRQDFQESVGQGIRRLAAAKRSVQPPGGVIEEGQFFFSNKIYVQLSLEQQVRLGALNPGTQNKCRKIRPWLVLWKLDNGNVIVVCSTTRENKVWEGVLDEDLRSFLPISPTPEKAGRRALQLAADTEGVFVGRSLLFLEIEKEVHPNFLGDYIGEISRESLQRLKLERQEWKRSNLSADRGHRPANVDAHTYPKIPNTHHSRNQYFGANPQHRNSHGIGWPPLSRRSI